MKKYLGSSFILLTTLFVFQSTAIAGISGVFVEPIFTYETGSGEITFPAPINSTDSTVKGFGVGARLGASVWQTVFAGIDTRFSMPKLTETTLNQDVKSKSWNGGPMIGVQMPTPLALRLFGSWILAGELDPDADKGVDAKFKNAKGFRIGGGVRVGIVSLNAEYQYIKYDESEVSESGVFTPAYNPDSLALKNKSLIVSVSIPIGL